MNRESWTRAAGWCWWAVVGFCLITPTLAEEDERVVEQVSPAAIARQKLDGGLPNPAAPLPVPFANGNPLIQNALLAPLQKKPTPKREDVSPQVREIEGVMPNSPLRGTIVDSGNPEENEAARRQLFAKWDQERLADERSNTQRVSDDGELSPGPALWPTQQDPLHAATMLLRASARQLDGLAADLEEAGKYPEADRLRARAKQMRNDARSFLQTQENATPR